METTVISKYQNFKAALDDLGKSVTIEIDPTDFKTLKKGKYNLCFAKKVGDTFNVVWQSSIDYLQTNVFSWTPLYQLFGTNSFQSGVKVVALTNIVSIGLGETSVLDQYGSLQDPATGGPDTAITMDNQYKDIHPGVIQLSTTIEGDLIATPIYVSADAIVKGVDNLTPKESVLVWFEQKIETSTMFSTARSNSVEIDLTHEDSALRLYKNGEWSTPDSD